MILIANHENGINYNTCSVKVTNLLPFPVKESQQSFTLNDALGFIQNKRV